MTQNPFQKVQETIKEFTSKMPGLDKEAMMHSHKKNMEALTEANKMAIEVMKSIAQLQTQYVKQTFEDISSIMRETISNAPASKEMLDKQSQHTKTQVDKAFEHSSNISAKLAKSQKEIFDLMHSRYHEGAKEIFDQHEYLKSKTKH